MKKIILTIAILLGLTSSLIAQTFDANVSLDRIRKHQRLLDNIPIQFGNYPNADLRWSTNQTNDSLKLGLRSSNTFIVYPLAAIGHDYQLASQSTPTFYIFGSATDNTKFISLTHNGTNAVIDSGAGVVSFPDGISAPMSPEGMMTFSDGEAATANQVQFGINASDNAQINVPTGQSFVITVNGVPIFEAVATSIDLKEVDLLNVGNITLDSIEADASTGLITMKGATAGTNKEALVWDFETNANIVGVSSTTGVQGVDFGTIGLKTDLYLGNIAGVITMGNVLGTNNESLSYDFESLANTVSVTSTTGVTTIDYGSIVLDADVTGDVTGNASTSTALASNPSDCVANTFANSIDASANLTCSAISDADVPNTLTLDGIVLTQEDVGATCTVGQMRIDTGGAIKELCYCEAENTWACAALSANAD